MPSTSPAPSRARATPSPRVYRRRRILVFGSIAVVLAAATYLPLTLLAPVGSATAHVAPFVPPENPPVKLAWPGYGASAIGAVGFPGVLAIAGDETSRSIASISKIVTSLVVLEVKPLAPDAQGPEITMTADDAALWHKYFIQDGSIEPVRAGLVLTQRQLMEAVLLPSANNYAESMALWAYGSMPKFLDAVHAWLAAHDLKNTTIVEPTGINPANQSTASDLVLLGKLALQNPTIASIVSMKSATLPYMGEVHNSNQLLGIDGVVGIKTGTLEESGACLLFAASIDVSGHSVEVVGVVLGGEDHDSLDRSVQALLKSAVTGFREVPLIEAGTDLATYSTDWGQSANAVATSDKSIIVWAGTPITVKTDLRDLRIAPTGQNVGTVEFTVADKTVTVPISLTSALTDPGPWWRLTHPFG